MIQLSESNVMTTDFTLWHFLSQILFTINRSKNSLFLVLILWGNCFLIKRAQICNRNMFNWKMYYSSVYRMYNLFAKVLSQLTVNWLNLEKIRKSICNLSQKVLTPVFINFSNSIFLKYNVFTFLKCLENTWPIYFLLQKSKCNLGGHRLKPNKIITKFDKIESKYFIKFFHREETNKQNFQCNRDSIKLKLPLVYFDIIKKW